jgi:DNA polymerase III subunit delta
MNIDNCELKIMITTLTGPNGFLLNSQLNTLINTFVVEHGDMGLEKIDGEDAEYGRIREALESLPFLASKKLVVLRAPSAQKQFVESIEGLIANVPDSTDVIIYEPKLDKRSVYYKTLKAQTELREYNELDAQGLAQWLVREAKGQGGILSTADALYLVDRIGLNQFLLSKELEKLLLYDPKITRQSIELLSERTPQSTIFELLEAAFAGQTQKALAIYEEQRQLKVEPIAIMALIAWQLHLVAVIKTAGQRSIDEIARDAKVSPYSLRKSQRIADKLTLKELKALIKRVLDLDISLKSKSIDADEALRNLILDLGQ